MKRRLAFVPILLIVVSLLITAAMADGSGEQSSSTVAETGGLYYDSLQEAVNEAATGAVVTLTKDTEFTTDDIVTVAAGTSITLNMNEHSITVDSDFNGRPIVNYGTLTITGNGTIDCTASANGLGPINNYGTLTIENGSYRGNLKANGANIWNRSGGTLIINDGTFDTNGGTISTEAGSTTTINDGTFKSPWYPAVDNNGYTTINGGDFINTSCSSCDSVHWGYSVRSGKNSDTAYLRFNDGNVTGTQGGLAIVGGTADIYDGEFKTVDCGNGHGAVFYALYVAGESFENTATVYGGTFKAFNREALHVGNDNPGGDSGNKENSTVIVRGGTFIGGGTAAAMNVENTENAIGAAIIYNGTFQTSDGRKSEVSEEFYPDGAALTQTENGSVVIDEAAAEDAAASVNGVYYDTLQNAVDAVLDNETVRLEKDAELTNTLEIKNGKTFTLDLNGYDIVTAIKVIEIQNAHVSITGEGTIKETSPYNGGIVLKGSNHPSDTNYTSVIIGEDVTIEAWAALFITPYASSGAPYAYGVKADVYGTLTGLTDTTGASGSAIYINGQIKHKDNFPVINVYDTAVLSSSGLIYAAGYAEWNIDGANITGHAAGIGIKSGILNVTGNAVIHCTGPNTAPTEGFSNGINASGAAIQIESNSDYAGDIVINIEDATITSDNGYAIYEYANNTDPLTVDKLALQGGKFVSGLEQVICVSEAMEQEGNDILTISGGSYSAPVPYVYLADDFNIEVYDSGNSEFPYSYYRNIQDAQSNASAGSIITEITSTTSERATVTIKYNDGTDDAVFSAALHSSVYLPTLSKSGYTFTGWRVNNSNTIVRGGESYTITADTTFTAVWNMIMIPDTYDIAVDQPAHGTVEVSFSNASQGSVITVTATPDEGYELVYITVDGEPISGNSFVMPGHAVEVSALFAEIGKEVNFVDVSRADWFYDYVQYVAQNGLMEGTTRTAFEPNASMTRAMFWTVLARIDGETITGDSWKTLAQNWAVESGISDGTNADALITREQMVTMLYRYAGSPVTGGMAISEFTDSASVSDYATDAVTWALSEGILTGMGDGILAPQGTATRAQAAAMLMRFVEA